MEKVKNFENKLLGRRELVLKLDLDAKTLGRFEAKAMIAKEFKAEEDLVIVKEILSHFGSRSVTIIANIYNSKEALDKVSRDHLIKRNTKAKAEGEEE